MRLQINRVSAVRSTLGRRLWRCVAFVLVTTLDAAADDLSPQRTNEFARALEEQGVPPGRIIGFDHNGVPIVCAAPDSESLSAISKTKPPRQTNAPPPTLPAGTRMWETIPGVIRND